jgi:Spy/CpxP family protein refolding chaperone
VKLLVTGIFVAALAASPVAFADDHHDSDNHGAMSGGMMGMPMRHHGWHHGDTPPTAGLLASHPFAPHGYH